MSFSTSGLCCKYGRNVGKFYILLRAVCYNDFKLQICGDFKVTGLSTGIQPWFTKFCRFLYHWDLLDRVNHLQSERVAFEAKFGIWTKKCEVSSTCRFSQDFITTTTLSKQWGKKWYITSIWGIIYFLFSYWRSSLVNYVFVTFIWYIFNDLRMINFFLRDQFSILIRIELRILKYSSIDWVFT